jgi:hypothetical protein
MTDASVALSRVHHAPDVPGFTALGHVRVAGLDHTCPMQMAAPLTEESDTISRALTRRGHSAHRDAKAACLRMVRPDLARLDPGLGLKNGVTAEALTHELQGERQLDIHRAPKAPRSYMRPVGNE